MYEKRKLWAFVLVEETDTEWEEKKKGLFWNSHHGSAVVNLTIIHEDVGLIPGLAQWDKDLALP